MHTNVRKPLMSFFFRGTRDEKLLVRAVLWSIYVAFSHSDSAGNRSKNLGMLVEVQRVAVFEYPGILIRRDCALVAVGGAGAVNFSTVLLEHSLLLWSGPHRAKEKVR